MLIYNANGPSGYRIANSLRFRSSASAYLNRTPGSAGNRKTWTFSAWVKRGALGAAYSFFGGWDNSTGATDVGTAIRFNADALDVFDYTNAIYNFQLTTTSVFRDPSSWYHTVIAFDTTQATASNRIKVYVNGSQITSFSTATYPNQNTDWKINNTVVQSVGCMGVDNAASQFFDGYLTEVNFIDGQALTPSSFGETDAVTGVWKPKAYSGTYGTNGFRLNFSNGTSTTTLGNDSSGNGNNWTTNNISLTAGSTYDWMIDSPVNSPGSSYGVGNYCVLMPFTICNAVSAGYGTSAASDGNLNYSSIGSTSNSWSSFALPLSGKYYAEMRFVSLNTGSTGVMAYDGNANRSVLFNQNGTIYNNNSLSQSLTSWSSGDTIGLAINMDSSTIQFYRNGSAVGNPESITVAYGQYFIFNRYNAYLQSNFGQRPFAYTPPSGFKSLCTQNLPVVTIYNGAQYMAATTYTGTGSNTSITNAGAMQPDFVWVKRRSDVTNHVLYDSVRGVGSGKALSSNLTNAEGLGPSDNDSLYGYVSALNSNGFSVAAGSSGSQYVNTNSATYVAWQWKAGGTAVTNTAGSITSQVSANTTAGFSVVTYTGTGANATVGHGLGVAPAMIIVKNRTTAATSWITYHASLPTPATQALYLNTTDSVQTSALFWNSTAPTSSVFSVAAYNPTNQSTGAIVAYCFAAIAGYSAFGSYTGNGSADGPFVYCGFRPRFLLVKRTDAASYPWVIFDTARSTYNVITSELYPNASSAEANSSNDFDIVSNGFKCRISAAAYNASSGTYIFAAFAENPFQNALAR